MTIEEMKNDYDWIEAWSYADNVPRAQRASVPQKTEGYDGPLDAVTMDDVSEIIASSYDQNDGGTECLLVVRLKDGRYLYLTAGCDYTGWDCQSGGQSWLANDLDSIIQFGLGEHERMRLRLGVK